MGKIFISYRRNDSGLAADRLFGDLSSEFGKGQVFMDYKSLKAGRSFVEQLTNTIEACNVVLVLIGPRWLNGIHEHATGEDYVVQEIAIALKSGIAAIPVLFDEAVMPQSDQLPQSIAAFALHQAVEIDKKRWDHDVGLLIAHVKDLKGGKWKSKAQIGLAAGGAAAGVGGANAALGVLGAAGLSASIPVVMGTIAIVLPIGAALGGYLTYRGAKRLLNRF